MATERKTNLYAPAGPIERNGERRSTKMRRLTVRELMETDDVSKLLKITYLLAFVMGAGAAGVVIAVPLMAAAAVRLVVRAVRR